MDTLNSFIPCWLQLREWHLVSCSSLCSASAADDRFQIQTEFTLKCIICFLCYTTGRRFNWFVSNMRGFKRYILFPHRNVGLIEFRSFIDYSSRSMCNMHTRVFAFAIYLFRFHKIVQSYIFWKILWNLNK